MVISHKHKYLFVELFYTGSTAISKELCELYDGEKILKKHSRYHEFLEIAGGEQKKYFIFSGIRNPMDLVVSEYLKIKNNHKDRFTTPSEWRKNGGTLSNEQLKLYDEITNRHLSFQDYFLKYFRLPYDNWSLLAHKQFDFIIRFENIRTDFNTALKKINIEPVRELPQVNKTAEKEDFLQFYTPQIRQRAIFVFGPFMQKWGYEFPNTWHTKKPALLSSVLFKTLAIVRKVYWGKTKSKSTSATKKAGQTLQQI